MKITNVPNGWSVEGMFITVFLANVELTDLELATYFDVAPRDLNYVRFKRPAKYDRYVLLKPNNSFVIVPVNNNTIVEVT